MSESQGQNRFATLVDQLNRGEISRRQFLAQGASLGVGLTMLTWFVRHIQTTSAYAPHPQDATATPEAGARPSFGSEGKTRGQDGELKVLLWQAVTLLSSHIASGTKDFIAADIVNEPLMRYLPDGTIIPNLVTEVPTIDNGGLNDDLTQVVFRLTPDIVWSDGTPFTADDVVFTWQWITDPTNSSVHLELWDVFSDMVATDPLTVTATFDKPNLTWYVPFTNGNNGAIYPKHYIEATAPDIMNTAPIGTGPFIVDSFAPNDQVIYSANPLYREPNKPYFATVNIKGGGEAATAAQSVLETGDWDHAWNIQVEPDIIANYEKGGQGVFTIVRGTNVERINFNFSDPDATGPDGQRSWYENPHPILSDVAVRQAIFMAVDRETITKKFYDPTGEGERVATSVLMGIPTVESPNTSYTLDPDGAAQVLQDAGWTLNGDTREKDGQRLELTYVTTINSVRQKTQQVAKQNLEAIGFRINLVQTDSAIFFDGSAGNEQNLAHMYHDVNMFTSGALNPTPVDYLVVWYSGTDGSNIAQQANGWNGQDSQRWVNADYDTLYEKLVSGTITDLAEIQSTMIQLNDLIINNYVLVPLVNRAADKYCMHNSLIHDGEDNAAISAFELNLWNVANWNRSAPVDR